ncbi:MAG TPA: aldo/keto reductase [Pseudonocardiaceae bacterium]|jgi:aryl-alcohol dehydrogenase-like predicted oxidoreductase
MRTRKLGRHGPELTVLGIGTWAMGGHGWAGSWGPQDFTESVATIRIAIDLGANWIDTAPAYGLGRAEEIVGTALAGRDDVLVATKCGERINGDRTYRSGRAAGIVADCESSLRRLRRDVIDLYQLHHPPPDVPVEEAWQAMVGLVTAGKVRHVGLCNTGLDELTRCLSIRHVDSYQGPYSLLRRKPEAEILPFCQDAGIGVLPFGALGHGFLSGRFDVYRLAPDDWRHAERWRDEIARGAEMTRRLDGVARRLGTTVGRLATAWLVDHPAVTATPVGTRSVAQARENFGNPLPADARALLADTIGQPA